MDVQMMAIVIGLVAVVRKLIPAVDGRVVVAGVSAVVGALAGAVRAVAAGADWKQGALTGAASGVAAAGAVHLADRVSAKGAA